MNKLTETAPERIWLQISDDVTDLDCEFHTFASEADITWCADSVAEAEVAYVRADLLEAANSLVERLSERLDAQAGLLGHNEAEIVNLKQRIDGFSQSIYQRQLSLEAANARIAELEAERAWRPIETAPLYHVQIRADYGEGTAQRVFIAIQTMASAGDWEWLVAIEASFIPMHAEWRVTGWKPCIQTGAGGFLERPSMVMGVNARGRNTNRAWHGPDRVRLAGSGSKTGDWHHHQNKQLDDCLPGTLLPERPAVD